MDAVNVVKIFDWLWTSGQLSEGDIKQLPERGFDTVINLALPTSTNALQGEGEMASNLHMNYFQIPVEWELPEVEQFVLFAKLLQVLDGRKVWLHCAMNMRVSVFVYLYRRFVLNEKENIAADPMNELWTPNEIWQEFIEEVSAYYSEKNK